MSGNVVEFGRRRESGGGRGPSGPDDEARFRQIEDAVQRVVRALDEIKVSQDKLLSGQHRVEVELAEMKGRIKGIEDRFNSMPTSLQLISVVMALVVAAGFFRFFEPRYSPPPVAQQQTRQAP
jgi:hypothetical protein